MEEHLGGIGSKAPNDTPDTSVGMDTEQQEWRIASTGEFQGEGTRSG